MTKDELKAIGVNPEYLTYPSGKYNIIVQCFGDENGEEEVWDDEKNDIEVVSIKTIYPDIFRPRKHSLRSCNEENGGIPFETEEDKKDWVAHLRDSAERLKILSHLLQIQANEIEEFGYPKTTCFIPE